MTHYCIPFWILQHSICCSREPVIPKGRSSEKLIMQFKLSADIANLLLWWNSPLHKELFHFIFILFFVTHKMNCPCSLGVWPSLFCLHSCAALDSRVLPTVVSYEIWRSSSQLPLDKNGVIPSEDSWSLWEDQLICSWLTVRKPLGKRISRLKWMHLTGCLKDGELGSNHKPEA